MGQVCSPSNQRHYRTEMREQLLDAALLVTNVDDDTTMGDALRVVGTSVAAIVAVGWD